MQNVCFNYGFEYLGMQDRLVQTSVTDHAYWKLIETLEKPKGASVLGPAGVGKTLVKALGHQLGRFVLVLNCDKTFDSQAIKRIFIGLGKIGAWGCFDGKFCSIDQLLQKNTFNNFLCFSSLEFNRLEEKMLCDFSQKVRASANTPIFITMDYARRGNWPDSLKKSFSSLKMTPQLIAEVMLFSQGFRTDLHGFVKKLFGFFGQCKNQLSKQSHYDFDLCALKSVLVSAGNVKLDRIQKIKVSFDKLY